MCLLFVSFFRHLTTVIICNQSTKQSIRAEFYLRTFFNFKINVDGVPFLCLFAYNDIEIGDELRYDYGENKNELQWRSEVHI